MKDFLKWIWDVTDVLFVLTTWVGVDMIWRESQSKLQNWRIGKTFLVFGFASLLALLFIAIDYSTQAALNFAYQTRFKTYIWSFTFSMAFYNPVGKILNWLAFGEINLIESWLAKKKRENQDDNVTNNNE